MKNEEKLRISHLKTQTTSNNNDKTSGADNKENIQNHQSAPKSADRKPSSGAEKRKISADNDGLDTSLQSVGDHKKCGSIRHGASGATNLSR